MPAPEEDHQGRLALILSRLTDLQHYSWNTDIEPFHSSYDNWHFVGRQKENPPPLSRARSAGNSVSSSHTPDVSRPSWKRTHTPSESNISAASFKQASQASDLPRESDRVVLCRVSTHTLRLEREYKLCQAVEKESDPTGRHFVRPVEFLRLPPKPGNTEPLAASIVEAPGPNYVQELVQFSSNAAKVAPGNHEWKFHPMQYKGRIPLLTFLDLAVGATECLEILHHQHKVVHGEIRGDAFHFAEDGIVKMINFGSGARSFENGLTSAGWNTLSKERGVELKLAFIAPEQTGRMPAEPDSRTDIYSLGILFFTMLCGETPFDGPSPLDVMQNVLNKRIPPVSSKRMDIPEALSSVIQRMSQKNIEERYYSTSGLKYDLIRIRELLSEGDSEGLIKFQVGSKDISCFFNLPLKQIGREKERQAIIDVIERVSKRRRSGPNAFSQAINSLSSNSSYSDPRMERNQIDDVMSDSTSSRESESRLNTPGPVFMEAARSIHQDSQESISRSEGPNSEDPAGTRPQLYGTNRGHSNHSIEGSLSLSRSNQSDGATSLYRVGGSRMRRRARCEIVAIAGASGLGKSRLVQSIQKTARSNGYFASAKFDPARKAPFEPILRLMSSLFRQIFSEANVDTVCAPTKRSCRGHVTTRPFAY
jgi:serine/threonine protein kinase